MDIIEDIAADFNIYVDVDGYTRHVQQLSVSVTSLATCSTYNSVSFYNLGFKYRSSHPRI